VPFPVDGEINEVGRDLRRMRDLTLLPFPFIQVLGTETCSTSMREAARWDLESQGRGESLKLAAADTVWREGEGLCWGGGSVASQLKG